MNDIAAALEQPVFLAVLSVAVWVLGSVIVLLVFWALGLPKHNPKLPLFSQKKYVPETISIWMDELLAIGVPFTILGVVIGYLTGVSQTPVVGSVLPAVLTLVAGISVFMASDGGRKGAIASSAMIYLSFALVAGVSHGSTLRITALAAMNSFEAKMQAVSDDVTLRAFKASRERANGLIDEEPSTDIVTD